MSELLETTRPLLAGPDIVNPPYPIKMKGKVIQGFGRGSRELGIPTANLSEAATNALCEDVETGIYFGWALVGNDSSVYPMEVHIMHVFSEDFYEAELRVIVLGRIRSERDYVSIDALIEDINIDIKVAHNSLARSSYISFKSDPFFLNDNN